MRRITQMAIGIIALLTLTAIASGAFAQQPNGTVMQATSLRIDERPLTQLYRQHLADPGSTVVAGRIATERERIRAQWEEEIRTQIQSLQNSADLAGEELVSAVERTRTELTATQERIKSRKLDLDSLANEERQYYLDEATQSGTGTLRLTTSHEELLAKRAILEEQITVLEGLETLQQQRLDSLVFDQRLEQFHILIVIGKYLLVIAVIMLIEKMIRSFLLGRIRNRDRRYTATKIFTSVMYLGTVLWIVSVIFSEHPGILTSLAIVGAGLAISLQDSVKDLIGWTSIHRSQLFSKGDRITVGGITGEVIDIGMFYTTTLEVGNETSAVLERTGKTIFIPNAMVLTQAVTNYHTTSDFIRAEMKFAVTMESNWHRAELIVKGILEEVTKPYAIEEQRQFGVRTRRFYIPHTHPQPVVHMDIGADGIDFTLRFTVPVGERRPVVTEITRRILTAFGTEKNIELAYKTSRTYVTSIEPRDIAQRD